MKYISIPQLTERLTHQSICISLFMKLFIQEGLNVIHRILVHLPLFLSNFDLGKSRKMISLRTPSSNNHCSPLSRQDCCNMFSTVPTLCLDFSRNDV